MEEEMRWYEWIYVGPLLALFSPGIALARLAEKHGLSKSWQYALFSIGPMILPIAACAAWAYYHPTICCEACHGRGYIDAP